MNPPPAGEPKRRLMTQWVFGINGWLMVIGVFLDYHSMWKRTPSLTKLCTPLTAGGDWKAKKRPSSARSLDFETRTRIETARSCQQFPSCRLTVSISFIFHRLFHIIHPRKRMKKVHANSQVPCHLGCPRAAPSPRDCSHRVLRFLSSPPSFQIWKPMGGEGLFIHRGDGCMMTMIY